MRAQLYPHKPTLLLPEELLELKQKKVDCLILIVSSPILTPGNEMRLQNVITGLLETGKLANIKTLYIGYKPNFLLPPDIKIVMQIPNDSSISKNESRKIIQSTLVTKLSEIKQKSTVGFLSTFQSGKDLHEVVSALKSKKELKGIFIGCESSFAYINEPEDELLSKRLRRDIKERIEFKSTNQVIAYFLRPVTPYIPITEVVTHPPASTYSLSTSTPISAKNVDAMVSLRGKTRKELKEFAVKILSTKNCISLASMLKEPDVVNIHLAINESCYDEKKVGTWWTPEQYYDSLKSAEILVRALLDVVQKTNKRILLTARKSFVNYIASLNIPNVRSINGISGIVAIGLYITDLPALSEDEHNQYMAANDLTVHRTIQANAYTKALYAGVPSIIFTTPGKGYMDAEDMDRSAAKLYKLVHFTSASSQKEISLTISKLIQSKKALSELIRNQNEAFYKTIKDKRIDFFDTVIHILGL